LSPIVEVVGARPNFMKVAPIHRHLANTTHLSPLLVHTGQHYDWGMSEVFLRDLGLPQPDLELGVGSGSHAEQTAQVMLRLEPYLAEIRPAAVVVVGDVNSTVAAALTAAKLHIPVAHVEAGLRSGDRTMPEELNRIVTDALSDLLLVPSREATENLIREGIADEKIHLVGNVMIDTLDALLPMARKSRILSSLGLEPMGYLVATLHRPSNVDEDSSLDRVVEALQLTAKHLPTVLVAHPRTQQRLRQTGMLPKGGRLDTLRLVEPLGYLDFIRLLSACRGVLTDSGGIQEEATVLGVPCLTLRTSTERPITVEYGMNTVVGLDINLIEKSVRQIVETERVPGQRPPLWDGKAAQRIVAVLADRFA
jgi:UDP-N-acetylglucosamine 2-epimerase (non-hydrolysing)